MQLPAISEKKIIPSELESLEQTPITIWELQGWSYETDEELKTFPLSSLDDQQLMQSFFAPSSFEAAVIAAQIENNAGRNEKEGRRDAKEGRYRERRADCVAS